MAKRVAKKAKTGKRRRSKRSTLDQPGAYQPPSPAEMMRSSVKMAVRDATMAHPKVRKLQVSIEKKMLSAAQVGDRAARVRNVRSA